jgi:hypothetical protein
MLRNSQTAARTFLSLFFALALLLGGCGRLSRLFEKPVSKPHFVVISWTPSASQVIGYNVYRAEPSSGAFVKITPQPVPATRYTDLYIQAGKTYTYCVSAVDARGVESKPSENKTATVPSP